MSSSPSTSPVFTIHRIVKDAADSGDITNRALGMNMHGYKSGVVKIIPSAAANPNVEVLFWSAEAGKFVSRVPAITGNGVGAGVGYEISFKAFGGVAFVKVTGGVAGGDTVTITVAGSTRQLAVADDVLLKFSDADVTQNTAGRYIWNPFTKKLYGPFGSGKFAYFDYLGDRFGQIHEAWDETCGKSETFSAWTLIGSASLASDDVIAPDTAKLADKLTFGAAAGDGIKIALGSATDNTDQTDAIFVNTDSGTKGFRLQFLLKDGTTATSGDLTATTAWQRFDFTADILLGATAPEIRIINDSGGNAGSVNIFGNNTYKDRSVPGPYMTNDTGADQTYAKDQVSWASGLVPHAAFQSGYAWKYIPFWAHDEPAIIQYFYTFYKDATHYLYTQYRIATDMLRVRGDTGGGIATLLDAGAVTHARNALLSVKSYPPLGRHILSGFASGDGTYDDTAFNSYIASDQALHYGQTGSSGSQINALITEPRKP